MLRAQPLPAPRPRRGTVLLVVLAMLTLFAAVGVAFVYYADAQAQAARLHREAQGAGRPGVDPELLLAFFLGQLLYDVPDDEPGIYSALRGHSLARSMYGWNADAPAGNNVPYNGVGRPHTGSGSYMNPLGVD